ncbi:Protein of unknown function [Bacillus mobilis]|nr:Protein of unknown function [Bacillus mobilis]
MHFIFKIRNRS